MIYRPDIKPPMWGPPEDVAYAVQTRLERAGVNPRGVHTLWPLWESAGFPFDLHRERTASFTGTADAQMVATGAMLATYSAGGATASLQLSPQFTLPAAFTFFAIVTPDGLNTAGNNNPGLWRTNDNGNSFLIGDGNSKQSLPLWLRVNNTDLRRNVGPTVTPQTRFIGCAFAPQDRACIIADKDFSETSHSIAAPSVRNIPRIGWHTNAGLALFHGVLKTFGFLEGYHPTLLRELSFQPYQLFMPVARPFIFDMAATGLSAPTLIAPANAATGVILRPEFSWT